MNRPLATALLIALVLPSACTTASPPGARSADAPLPTDPRLVTGRLDNGFSYVIRRHATPEKRVGLWLHVATGSLNETDETRGIAHYLEHLAFNGSANFPPGALVPFFERLGLTFGRDQNAFTTFDQTVYQIALPAGQPDALDKGLLFLSDVASRLTLAPAEVEAERRVILEEKRVYSGVGDRIGDAVTERLAPESTLGRRLPIGTEATILRVTAADFQEYYRRWYVASNMTLLVVGDCDPAEVAATLARHFGQAPAVPRPTPRPVGVVATRGTRAILATDPDLTRAEVSLLRVEPARAPTTTVAGYRRDLVESLGAWMLRRRLEVEAAEGRTRFEDGHASIVQRGGAMRAISVRANGRPERWRDMLADLGVNLQRARLHGFGDRELQDARAAFSTESRDAVARDTTAPIRQVLFALNGAIARRVPLTSPAQHLALQSELLPGITAAEVSRAVKALFDLTDVVAVVTLPAATADRPSEADIARLARTAADVTPEAAPERARPDTLLAEAPRTGEIADRATDAASDVTSVWLGNGVRAHHRTMRVGSGEVLLVVGLAGGAIEETAATRGITEAAARAWSNPATSRLSSTAIRDLLVGRRVRGSPGVGEDAVSLTVRTTPADLEAAFQLVYLLLTDPVLEPVAFARWQDARLRDIDDRRTTPMAALRDAAAEALAPPHDARMRPLGRAQVTAVTREAAQAWLRRLVAGAPIEASVVGDVDASRALDLVARYLGALPPRDRIGAATLAPLRRVSPVAGPIRLARQIETRTPQAAVLVGFRGADARDRRDARMLALAARILSTRMYRTIREERQLVYSIGAGSTPSYAYPGFGTFAAQAPTDPARAQTLAAAIEAMYDHFGAEGPTEAETAIARRQLVNQVDDQLQRPEFWASRLADSEYRGESPRQPLEARAQYEQATAHDIHETFRRYAQPAARFTIVVEPAPAGVR